MDLKFKEFVEASNNSASGFSYPKPLTGRSRQNTKGWWEKQRQPSGLDYPKPLTGAAIGGYLGYAFGGPLGGLAGGATGYGLGKLFGPRKSAESDPKNWIYYRGSDGVVTRYPKPHNYDNSDDSDNSDNSDSPKNPDVAVNITPAKAFELSNDPSHPYNYKQFGGGWHPTPKSAYQIKRQQRWQSSSEGH